MIIIYHTNLMKPITFLQLEWWKNLLTLARTQQLSQFESLI